MSRLLFGCLMILSVGFLNAQSPNANPNAAKDIPAVVDSTLEDLADFNKWKQNNGKKFDSAEDKYRFLVFKQNKKIIKEHNDKKDKKFKMVANQFAAETKEEFALKHLGAKPPNREAYINQIRNKKQGEIISPVQIPTLQQLQALIEKQKKAQQTQSQTQTTSTSSPANNGNGKGKANGRNLQIVPPSNPPPINWKTIGKVSPIRNQGSCGSCYAFSAVGAIESAYLIERNQTVGLSEQQLVDCSIFLGNEACSGGWPDYAYNYIIYYNITTRVNYPYINNHIYCQQVGGQYQLSTYVYTEQGCSGLIAQIQNRPFAVAIDALPWQFYQSGVFDQCKDPAQTSLNHAAVLVGYDSNMNWIIKNSWGAGWGQEGYITLEAGNNCGICDFPGMSPYL